MLSRSKNIIILLVTLFTYPLFSQTNLIIVEGYVLDSKSNERISKVDIFNGDSVVAITNDNGYFTFKIGRGKNLIIAKHIGYKQTTILVNSSNINHKTSFIFRLKPNPVEITQVTVTGENFIERVKYKTYELLHGDLNNIPQVGEQDALRALQVLPGITSISDFSSQLYVRGGNFDETLIAVDDVPVYNPYHLGSFFSMFNTDIIESEILYPSNYPVKYGGYLSGVLNIKTKTGNWEKFKGSASIGLISSKGFLESPIGNGSLILAGRRTYFDLLGGESMPYFFYDTYAKLTYPIDKNNLISLSGFYSRDVFKIFKDQSYSDSKIEQEPNWGNNVLSLNLIHLYGKNNSVDLKLFYSSSTLGGKGKSIYHSYLMSETNIDIDNNIRDLTGVIKVKHFIVGHQFEFGIEYKNIELNYYWDIGNSELSGFGFEPEEIFYDFAPTTFSNKNNTSFISFFVSDKIIFSKALSLSLGLRNSFHTKLNKNLISPSINLEYSVNSDIEFQFSYGRYFQNMFLIKDQTNPMLDPFSIYFTPQNYNELPSSNNFSSTIIFSNLFFENSLEITGYYNFKNNLPSSYLQNINKYSFDDGYSTGLEFLFKNKFRNSNFWLSYSLARSIKANNKFSYFAKSDRTHSVKILFSYSLSDKWNFTSYWMYSTGFPYTPQIGKYVGYEADLKVHEYDDEYFYWYPVYGTKNSARNKSYHRLDIGFNGTVIWRSLLFKPYLQILNVYNSPNSIPATKNRKQLIQRNSFIIPTIGVTVEF